MSTGLKIKAEAAKSLLPPFGTYIGKVKYYEVMDPQPNPFKEGTQQVQMKLGLVVDEVMTVDFDDDEEAAEASVGEEAWAYATLAIIEENGTKRWVFTPRAKLRIWSQSIVGRQINDDDEFDFDELTGKPVMFKVKPNTKGNPTVDDITGYRKRRSKKREPEPEPEAYDEFEEEDDEDLEDF